MRFFIPIFLFLLTSELQAQPGIDALREGDILFQTSGSSQSLAIQTATRSPFSHVGIVLAHDGELMVAEAVQPVQFTPLEKWIADGKDNFFAARRLKDAEGILVEEKLAKMRSLAEGHAGKDYDIYFGWGDDQLYCSELVWKLYKEATGLEIGTLKTLDSFDLKSPLVRAKLKERYGDRIPYKEKVISPADILDSGLLDKVE